MKTDHIKKRNMVMQVVLAIVTLGIYAIYWYYSTLKEMHIANGKDEGAVLWTVLSVIPPEPPRQMALFLGIQHVQSGQILHCPDVHDIHRILANSLVPGPIRPEQNCERG
jgi:hypothetical protein